MKPGIINTTKMSNTEILPVIAWLQANGINPNLMPREQKIIITGQRIIYTVVERQQIPRGGKRPVLGGDDFFARETKTTRIRVPFKATK